MCVSVLYSYIMYIMCVRVWGIGVSCIHVFMHGCIWVYTYVHASSVGGVHVRMYICVYECLQF